MAHDEEKGWGKGLGIEEQRQRDSKIFYFHDTQTKPRLDLLYNVDLILRSDVLVGIKMANKM